MDLMITATKNGTSETRRGTWANVRKAAFGYSDDSLDLIQMKLENGGSATMRTVNGHTLELRVAKVVRATEVTLGQRLIPGCTCGATPESNRCRCD